MNQTVTAFNRARPGTNLLPDTTFSLPPNEAKQGFLGVFNKRYSGPSRKIFLRLALAPLMDTRSIPMGRPPKATTDQQAVAQRAAQKSVREWEGTREDLGFHKFTKIKKVNGIDPHFQVDLPILLVGKYDLPKIFAMFSAAPIPADAETEFSTLVGGSAGSQLYKPALVLANAAINKDLESLLTDCFMGVNYEYSNGTCLMSLRFRVSEREAEHLVSEEWIGIRPVDIYPLFSAWAAAEYESKFYGKSAISVSKIAATLPVHAVEDERVDQYGIAVTMAGAPIFLPSKLDNTEKYESMFSSVGANSDGSFSLATMDKEAQKAKAKLPSNVPVLIDWTNYKFCFTNSQGRIEVLPLEHLRRCTPSMAENIIARGFKLEQLGTFCQRYAARVNLSESMRSYASQADIAAVQAEGQSDPYYWMGAMLSAAINTDASVHKFISVLETECKRDAAKQKTWPVGRDLTSDSPSPAFNWIQRFMGQLYPAMINNLDAIYVQYAVRTVTDDLGVIAVMANYGNSMAETSALAAAQSAPARNQGVDPNWTPPDAPLVTKKFSEDGSGLLPHQAKVRNLLKDSPEHAILSVDAGGGKSMLSITDVLYEVKAKRSAPYLIMCPSHLVANYVSEIVEFTDGMVNVLPITSYNIRTSGYSRYEQILESAPINTILVVDYDALKFRARSAVYGTATVVVFPVIEMIRKFRPGYAMLDECHLIKNAKSTRYRAVMALIADIPKKRIASGTLNPDSPSDLAGQVAILDPTIFGDREEFNTRFGVGYTGGGRVMEWQPNAGDVALNMIKRNCVWAQAKRKEWASALPKRKDRFLAVELTPNQRAVYQALFDEMVTTIRKKAENDKNAKRLLEGLSGKKASKEDEDAFSDLGDDQPTGEEDILEEEDDIGASLQPYLAAIEQFVSDPSGHPYAQNGFIDSGGERHEPLTGDDLKSPKAVALAQDLEEWFANHKSKALVFVNYHATAQALFKAMPPELQATGFVYEAGQKVEMVNRFKTDPSVKWMIGIRKSLEVGLNLQVAGLLVRMEGCWTPGEQEQGDSRIARPYFGKGGDNRDSLLFDTIVANYTIDITKAARLRAKIVALAKFENATDERYQEIESIPVFPMSLDYILTKNDFETSLAKYQSSMDQLNSVIRIDYEEYRERIKAEGGFKMTPIVRAATPPEAALLSRVPYAQGTELYSAAQMGLIRLDNFLGTEMSAEGDDEEGGDEDELVDGDPADPRQQAIREQLELIVGLRCHTEYGDGEIVTGAAGSSPFVTRVQVRLDDGTTARNLRSTNVFVMTRTETNSSDMRLMLAKAAGLQVVGDITVPGNNLRVTKVTKKMQRDEERRRVEEEQARKAAKKERKERPSAGVSLRLSIINGYMRLSYEGDDSTMRKSLQAVGFKMDQPYVATRIRDYKHMIAQAREWQEAGFDTSKEVDNDSLSWLAHELASNGLRNHRHYTNTVQKGFQNYLRQLWKPNASPSVLNLFALVTDGGADDAVTQRRAAKEGVDPSYGIAYLCLPYGAGFPGTKEAIKEAYRRPASRWVIHQGHMSVFVGSLDGVRKIFSDLRDAGISLANKDELEAQAKSVKKVQPKVDKTLDLAI